MPARGYSVDTLDITEIATGPAIEQAWKKAVENDDLTLPEDSPPGVMLLDGFTRVIELRQGPRYRTSTVRELGDHDKSEVARQVRAIGAAVTALLPRDK